MPALRYSPLRPTSTSLDRLRITSQDQGLTYRPVGGSATGAHPTGYHTHSSELTVDAEWDSAREAIRRWAGHRSVGGVLSPAMPPLDVGSTMTFGIRVLGVWATGACRIVNVIDEERDFGFCYGTLPHHPEEGEEMFAVRDNRDGTVTFRVVAFSKPAGLLTTLIGPLGRLIQRVMTSRYLVGFAAYATSVPSAPRR